jgi:hypothetical protein
MLRNLLYSLFLHFIALVLIYLNAQSFYYHNLQTLFDKKGKPVKVSLIDVSELNKKLSVQKPVIKEEKEVMPVKPIEPKKKPKISTEKIAESVKQKPTKAEQTIKNYEYIKKPDSPPRAEQIMQEEEYDNTLDDIINETINFDEVEKEQTYADEGEAVEMETGEDIKNVINLSIRERANIQRQIRSCYKMAILRSGVDSTTKVRLRVSLKKDGNINMKEVIVLNEDMYAYKNEKERESFEIAVENAKTALVFCSPLRNLPDNKYRVWKEMSLEFDSNKIEVKE